MYTRVKIADPSDKICVINQSLNQAARSYTTAPSSQIASLATDQLPIYNIDQICHKQSHSHWS
jgi:hypothetical protein